METAAVLEAPVSVGSTAEIVSNSPEAVSTVNSMSAGVAEGTHAVLSPHALGVFIQIAVVIGLLYLVFRK